VNTGDHVESLRKRDQLRGGFDDPKNSTKPLEQIENSLYTGKHWIQCFIIKGNTLVAESKPFFVNVFNNGHKKFFKRRKS
jgi:hypothetical protein